MALSFSKKRGRPNGARDLKPRKPRSKLQFKQTEIMRALRAARAQGLTVSGVEVDPKTGTFRLLIAPSIASTDEVAA